MNSKVLIFVLAAIFLLNPFLAFILSWILLFNNKMGKHDLIWCLIVISAFWGILAFTQKSHAEIDTDCIRYYYGASKYESMHLVEALADLDFSEILHFTFVTLTTAVVSLTGNVQSMSFLWVFITYIATYQSVHMLMILYNCYTQRSFAFLILLLTFGFILFVQVSELLKQASAFAVFFYGFTLYLAQGINTKTILFVVASIGIHPSMAMALPLFFYNLFPTKKLLIAILILTPIFMSVNFVELFYSLLPNGQYFKLLMEKYSPDVDGPSGTPQYIVIEMLMLMMAIDLWRRTKEEKCVTANIVILYFLVSFANFSNLVAFLRFALFSHWLFALMLVRYRTIYKSHLPDFAKIIVIGMFLLSARFTSGRLFGGFYSSSYMENSIVRISTSTSVDYFNEKYYMK